MSDPMPGLWFCREQWQSFPVRERATWIFEEACFQQEEEHVPKAQGGNRLGVRL